MLSVTISGLVGVGAGLLDSLVFDSRVQEQQATRSVRPMAEVMRLDCVIASSVVIEGTGRSTDHEAQNLKGGAESS